MNKRKKDKVSYLSKELSGFNMVELWFYVIGRIRNGKEHLCIVDGGRA